MDGAVARIEAVQVLVEQLLEVVGPIQRMAMHRTHRA
jgi:hypothetical protein